MYKYRTFLNFSSAWVACIFLILIFKASECTAQTVSSVKAGADTTLIKHLIDSGRNANFPAADVKIYEKPLELSIAGNYTFGILRSLNSMALVYARKNDFDSIKFIYNKAFSYCHRPVDRAWCLGCMGDQYMRHSDLANCSEKYFAALNEISNDTDTDWLTTHTRISIYAGLAQVYLNLQDYKNEVYYFNLAETLARKSNLYYDLSVILINKGDFFTQQKKPDSAGMSYMEAAAIIKNKKIRDRESGIDVCIGNYFISIGEYEKAIVYYKEAVDTPAINYTYWPDRDKMMAEYGMGDALFHLGKFKQAETAFRSGLGRAYAMNSPESIDNVYLTLSKIYRATGQYNKALDYLDSTMLVRDSVLGAEKAAATARVEVRYKLSEKDRQLSMNQLLIAQQSNKIARENIWMISIGSGFLLLLLVSSIVYLQNRNKQWALEKENKIGILKAAVEGGDNERTRIARELHDGIGGMLSAAMMRFSSMHHENPEIADTSSYKDAMSILREMGDEIRKTAHNLMPEVLLKLSLPEAIRIYCNNAREEGTLEIDFQSYGSFYSLSQGNKLNLYRITQELIKNASLHSSATKVLVQLLQNEDKLIVSVEDNGKGFNIDEIKGGLGLHNIRTRVSSMDGHFTLESKPGKGTTVIIELETPGSAATGQAIGLI